MEMSKHLEHERVKYEMLINGVDKPFALNIRYCMDCEIPLVIDWVAFKNARIKKHITCKHGVEQYKQYRFFIKHNPDGIKPFTLKISICPECHLPVDYKFVIYPGDLKKYPKVGDLLKKKTLKAKRALLNKLPRAVEGERLKVKYGCAK